MLIRGERGTGKELFARYIHEASGREGDFIALNCSTLPEELAEAELFGHARGAFTGAGEARSGLFVAASGGTLLLDEVGDLSPQVQAKILRVLQEGMVRPVGLEREIPVDVRVVAATWRDLEQMKCDGEFREDLYDRLAWCVLELPPLKDRGRDVLLLAKDYLDRSHDLQRMRKGLARDAEQILLSHTWPGNVREMQRVIFQSVVEGKGRRVSAVNLVNAIDSGESEGCVEVGASALLSRDDLVDVLSESGEIGMAALEHASGASRSHLKRLLVDLVEHRVVVRTGRGPATRYRALVKAHAKNGSGRDARWLVATAIVEQEGRVTRSRLAAELAVSNKTATRVLTAMVAAKVLTSDGNGGNARGYVMAVAP